MRQIFGTAAFGPTLVSRARHLELTLMECQLAKAAEDRWQEGEGGDSRPMMRWR